MIESAAMLAVPLTVAVHRIKKPCIYAGFDNLNTDEHRLARMKNKKVPKHLETISQISTVEIILMLIFKTYEKSGLSLRMSLTNKQKSALLPGRSGG